VFNDHRQQLPPLVWRDETVAVLEIELSRLSGALEDAMRAPSTFVDEPKRQREDIEAEPYSDLLTTGPDGSASPPRQASALET
jgi:hypothetical protein